jgi:hypothetical protein
MKTYTLKDCTFTADVATAAEIRALSDAEIDAIMRNAMSSWAYRRGAKADNHGKHFALKAIVADMLATGERSGADGGMTKVDEKELAALFKSYGLTCADDIIRGHKTEEAKDAAVAKFVAHWDCDTELDPELAASDNAVAAFQDACGIALDRAIDKWNAKVSASGAFTRTDDDTTIVAALAFLRHKRRFAKEA